MALASTGSFNQTQQQDLLLFFELQIYKKDY